MQSFRSELEDLNNPVVEKDIVELANKIQLFNEGKIDEEKFRSLRLARGVYGQRQSGVQMIRIKLPYGKMTVKQLERICEVSDKYSTGKLHTTTRQDIQIHYVSLDRTPELWADLEKDQVTLREACGNTVRNITASPLAGIDPKEPFDVTPYAHEFYEYFLRNPICQDMGRKFKIAFSSGEDDTAFVYMHDLGFIPKIKNEEGKEIRGFKVLLAGGLGSQPRSADVVYEFLEEEKIIPFTEGVLRIFDRHGERSRRNNARIKFLIKKIGVEAFMELVKEEERALGNKTYAFDKSKSYDPVIPGIKELPSFNISDQKKYEHWKETNVVNQKQEGFAAIQIKLKLGDITTEISRKLAKLVKDYAGDDIRVTINQGLLLKYVREEYIPFLFAKLDELGLAEPGFDTLADITSCPGTDTCNLGVTSSTGISLELEKLVETEYPALARDKNLKIKISGCMNSCGQHVLANIGFFGVTTKVNGKVAPALQLLLGGGPTGDGLGTMGEKIIKVPSKKAPDLVRGLLDDYLKNGANKEFNSYYLEKGKKYFQDLLKPYTETDNLKPSDFIDWGRTSDYVHEVGIGECAGVTLDLVSTLIFETEEKLDNAKLALDEKFWADSIYHSYNTFINGAKALLVARDVRINTQASIISAFDEHFVDPKVISLPSSFESLVYQIKENEPTEEFAEWYYKEAKRFYDLLLVTREKELLNETK